MEIKGLTGIELTPSENSEREAVIKKIDEHLCSKCNEKAVKTEDYLWFDKIQAIDNDHPEKTIVLQGILRLSGCKNCIEEKLKESISEQSKSIFGAIGYMIGMIILGIVALIIARIVMVYANAANSFGIIGLFIFGGISWAIKEKYSDLSRAIEIRKDKKAAYRNLVKGAFDNISSLDDIMRANSAEEYFTLINIPQAQKLIDNNVLIDDISSHKEIFNPLKHKDEGYTRFYWNMKYFDINKFYKDYGNGTSIPEWLMELYEKIK